MRARPADGRWWESVGRGSSGYHVLLY